jgi:hypothetical protein
MSTEQKWDNFNHSGATSLGTDLDTAIIFTRLALEADAGSAKRVRNRENARRAYDILVRLSETINFAPSEREEFEVKLSMLKANLQSLGEPVP